MGIDWPRKAAQDVPASRDGRTAEGPGGLEELLARSSEGDREAFAALYQTTAGKLFAIIRRICPVDEAAREALQECYVLIWKNAGTYDPAIAAPLTWMARIARNKAVDIRRSQAERIASASGELDLDAPGPGLGPEAEAERSDELRRLENCLRGLDGDRREMILLAYYEGLSREELSERFARPINTIKTSLRRGLAQLRKCLDGHD